MCEIVIKDFIELLNTCTRFKNKIKNIELRKIPQSGYGSVMAKVKITLSEDCPEEKVYVVAKLLPTDPFVKKAFNIEVTYKNEVAFYHIILPTIANFQKEHGVHPLVDMFPKYYCSRLSLEKKEVDDDAVLVLEDLSLQGFTHIDRHVGFDLEGAKIVLKNLASFQGTTIALKIKAPEIFEKYIKAHCKDFQFLDELVYTDLLKDIIRENKNYAHLADRIGQWPCKVPEPRDPYATLAHADLWVNNTMQKFENGRIASNIIMDFQLYSYRSCASDVFFFLWTSCGKDVIENHLDDLLKYYHENLIGSIKKYNCDTALFTYERFLEDVKLESTYEFGHALTFVVIVKDKPIIDENNMKNNVSREELIAKLPQRVKDFIYFMVEVCDKRGWLH